MHYFAAMGYLQKGDVKSHVKHLDKAIEADPTDADALIALHRLANQDERRRAKTLKLIQAAAETFRQQIAKSPKTATAYNQFAWLVSNTEGDFQEALRYSKKSLKIRPNTSAYLDTLGRCFYAVRDYKNALKNQRLAVELDPHARQLRRQLDLFEQAGKTQAKRTKP